MKLSQKGTWKRGICHKEGHCKFVHALALYSIMKDLVWRLEYVSILVKNCDI